jgi:hypothetical protein
MAVESQCPHCGAAYSFTTDLTGKEVNCDECAANFVVEYRSNTITSNGGNHEDGIKTAADQMQSQAPRLRPRVNEEDEPISRQPITKSPGCSIFQIFVLLAILLLAGGFIFISGYGGGDSKETHAIVGIKDLEQAVSAYYLDYDQYPNELADLTVTLPDGKAAKLPQTALTDPWGQPYGYEPKNLHPQTKKPRIWSSGEPGARRPITNW